MTGLPARDLWTGADSGGGFFNSLMVLGRPVSDADLRLMFQGRKNNVTCCLFMIKKENELLSVYREASSYMTAVYS